MTEGEAKRIFEEKLPLCEALGLDVRAKCLEAGVPPAMIEKLLAAHKAMRVAMSRLVRDPSVLPTSGKQKAGVFIGEKAVRVKVADNKMAGHEKGDVVEATRK